MEIDPATGTFTNAIGAGTSGQDELLGVTYDAASKGVFVTGYFTGPSITLPGTAALTSLGASDIIIAAYSVANNNFIWSKVAGGAGNDRANTICSDNLGWFAYHPVFQRVIPVSSAVFP
ncbi:MAG: hypothetical protein WDO19_24780 [Bacteroidota bacterium]